MSYTYDAWGMRTVLYYNSGNTTAAIYNPFGYRGYYYDRDLGMYYLNARYYDPYTARFINADAVMSGNVGALKGYNLYAYCFNNPINLTDADGCWPDLIQFQEKCKEHSFVYNVLIKNISADAGVGIGIGLSADMGIAEFSAISRVDIIGVEFSNAEIKVGHHGKSGISLSVGTFSIGAESKTYESFDGTEYERYKSVPDVGIGVGAEAAFVFSVHAGASISLSGIYEEFRTYGRRHGWW